MKSQSASEIAIEPPAHLLRTNVDIATEIALIRLAAIWASRDRGHQNSGLCIEGSISRIVGCGYALLTFTPLLSQGFLGCFTCLPE